MFVQRSIAEYKSPLMETTCGKMSQFQVETMFECFMKVPKSKLRNYRSCPTKSKFPGQCVCRGGSATCWGSGQPRPRAGAPPPQPHHGHTRPQAAQQGHIFFSRVVKLLLQIKLNRDLIFRDLLCHKCQLEINWRPLQFSSFCPVAGLDTRGCRQPQPHTILTTDS